MRGFFFASTSASESESKEIECKVTRCGCQVKIPSTPQKGFMKKFTLWVSAILLFLVFAVILVARFTPNHEYAPYYTVKTVLKSLSERVKEFKKVCGRYPTSEEGLEALLENSKHEFCPSFPIEGFIEGDMVPLNPWDKKYQYHSDGLSFEIFTMDDDGNKLTSK